MSSAFPTTLNAATDTREFLLQRLQDVLKTVTPGVQFTFPAGIFPPDVAPGGLVHRTILTDLQGRVYSKMRAAEKIDQTDKPFVEIITSPTRMDRISYDDDNLYTRELGVEIWAYASSSDAGDDPDSIVRAQLNTLLADLSVAVEAFPYWGNESLGVVPLTAVVGPVMVLQQDAYTEPATESAAGTCRLDYLFRYKFNRLNP